MIKENTLSLALQDTDKALWGERFFSVIQITSCFEGGLADFVDQKKFRPTSVMIIKTFFLLPASLAMINPELIPYSFEIAIFGAAWASGGILNSLCRFVHEEYGTDMFGVIYGSFLTAGAFGFYACNEILFAQIFDAYAEAPLGGKKQLREFGEWNQDLFGICTVGALIALICSIVTHCSMAEYKERKSTSVVF